MVTLALTTIIINRCLAIIFLAARSFWSKKKAKHQGKWIWIDGGDMNVLNDIEEARLMRRLSSRVKVQGGQVGRKFKT